MRLFPPIWGLIRIAADDDVIEGHQIRKGDKAVICTYVMHHSPKYWEEPEKFDPERFAPERAKKRVKYSYLPFAAGKRACIGGALSQIENTLALVQLLRRFTPGICGARAGEDPRDGDALPQRRAPLPHPRIELTPSVLQSQVRIRSTTALWRNAGAEALAMSLHELMVKAELRQLLASNGPPTGASKRPLASQLPADR